MQFILTLKQPRALFEFVELEDCQKSSSYETGFLADMSLTELGFMLLREIGIGCNHMTCGSVNSSTEIFTLQLLQSVFIMPLWKPKNVSLNMKHRRLMS